MPEKIIIREVAALCEYRGSCAPSLVEFKHGEFALSALALTTAEDLLAALRPLVGIEEAKRIVEPLLDHGLLFDSTIESEIDHAAR